MLLYCLKCRKNKESNNQKLQQQKKDGRIMVLSKRVVCDSKNSEFLKQQKASGLLSNLRIKIPLNKIPLLGPLLY